MVCIVVCPKSRGILFFSNYATGVIVIAQCIIRIQFNTHGGMRGHERAWMRVMMAHEGQ